MANHEKNNSVNDTYGGNKEKFTQEIHDAKNNIRQRLEQDKTNSQEKESSSSERLKEARREALESATSSKDKLEKKHEKLATKTEKLERRIHPATKLEKKASYRRAMNDVKSQMSKPSRVFSDFIHNPVVEKTSAALGSTVARPNAILSGSISAFALSLVIYLVARAYGYPLSGSESIAAFILGWIIGIIYDYLRLLTGKRNK